MRRDNYLIEKVADSENLRVAFWKAAKGKRYSSGVLAFGRRLEQNLSDLRDQILSGKVSVGKYHFFRIYDPKERRICASAFSEQVLHHALMNICHPWFEKVQIYDSYACRKGKGTYAAIDRAKSNTLKYPWYLKLDVRKFFENIHHEVLRDQLARMFKDRYLLRIFDRIIGSYSVTQERGLPIGNLTSQYFANHYLSGLDHHIKEELRIKAYVRYMDDLVLWHWDKNELNKVFDRVQDFVHSKLLCQLKPEILNITERGLPFLGYILFPFHVRLSQRSKQRFIKKLRHIEAQYHSGNWSEATCGRHALPLVAFTQHADAEKFRKNVILRLNGPSS